MHVSRNKCELIAECCITGVKPEYDIYGQAYLKDLDISKIEFMYIYSQKYCIEPSEYTFELLTQSFYSYLNDNKSPRLNPMNVEHIFETEDEKLKKINKYREMEEWNYV